jgi:translation initiation factor 4G
MMNYWLGWISFRQPENQSSRRSSFACCRAPRTDLSPEDRESLGKSLFSDFISSRNVNEAIAAAQELLVPGYGRILVTIGIEKAFDALNAEEQNAITRLIIDLAAGGTLAAGDVRSAIDDMVPELEDLALDVPTAPRVLGLVLGGCAEKGVFGLDVMAAQVGTVEGAEPRRALVAAALLAIKESAGAERMAELVKAGEVDVQKLLQHDAGFEGHLPDASEFAKEQGIAEVMWGSVVDI